MIKQLGTVVKKVIVVGATSGIGKSLALGYAKRGWEVGITGRRVHLLQEISALFPGKCHIKQLDVRSIETAKVALYELIEEMGSVDLIIVNAGTGHVNVKLEWGMEIDCILTNVNGFAAMCNVAMQHFFLSGRGHLAGVSSIAGVRGVGGAPAYSASKAFVINYLESLRGIVYRKKLAIKITNIQPGFIDTAMGQNERAFWRATSDEAATQIIAGLNEGSKQLYVTKRWRYIAYLLKWLPQWIIDRLG